MGIDGCSTNILSFPPKKLYLNNKKNKYVVIDASSVGYRYGIGSLNSLSYIVDDKGEKVSEQYFFFVIALRFLSAGIIPIFVFDGKNPKSKSDTIDKRRASKNKASDMIIKYSISTRETEGCDFSKDIIDASTDDHVNDTLGITLGITGDDTQYVQKIEKIEQDRNYLKYLKRSYQLNAKNVETSKTLLGWMGVPVIDAPGEADPQCAVIASDRFKFAGDILGVITDDSDALMYRGSSILKLPNLGSNHVDQYTLEDTLYNLSIRIKNIIQHTEDTVLREMYKDTEINFTCENLIDIGCLMGNDYCPAFKFKKSDKMCAKNRFDNILEIYAKCNMSLDNVLDSMRNFPGKKGCLDTSSSEHGFARLPTIKQSGDSSYIRKVLNAKNVYIHANVFDPNELDISFKCPHISMIRKMCENIILPGDLEKALGTIKKAYEHYSLTGLAQHTISEEYKCEIVPRLVSDVMNDESKSVLETYSFPTSTQYIGCVWNKTRSNTRSHTRNVTCIATSSNKSENSTSTCNTTPYDSCNIASTASYRKIKKSEYDQYPQKMPQLSDDCDKDPFESFMSYRLKHDRSKPTITWSSSRPNKDEGMLSNSRTHSYEHPEPKYRIPIKVNM
jgi:5'-3' exonuclease